MRRDIVILQEMIDAGERIGRIIGGMDLTRLRADEVSQAAVLWYFTIVGEAANQISDELKGIYPHVAWAAPTRMRNRIVHGYWDVDLDILHNAALLSVPALVADLKTVLADVTQVPD